MFATMVNGEKHLITQVDWRPIFNDDGKCIEREISIKFDYDESLRAAKYRVGWFVDEYVSNEIQVHLKLRNDKTTPVMIPTTLAEAMVEYQRKLQKEGFCGVATGAPEWLLTWYSEQQLKFGTENVFHFNRTNEIKTMTYDVDLFEELMNS